MACEKPLKAYQPTNGGPVWFNKPTHITSSPIELPCGQCILCRLEHARQWAVRITHEAQLHDKNCFVTLTYNDHSLPPHNSLDYRHLQLFWKRLRKEIGPLRYYAVGEYGDTTTRPHYHACIFGHAFEHNRTILKTTPHLLWTNQVLEKAWGMGHVSVGALTFQTAQYTASYVTKKLNNQRQYVRVDEETGELIPLIQPRAFMSLRPAIGREWLDKYGNQIKNHDHVVIAGKEQKPPKYYDNWLNSTHPQHAQQNKERRKQHITPRTDEQNRARARNAHARANFRKTL